MNPKSASTKTTAALDEVSAGVVASQPQNPDRPVEQTRKNIQVLKGLPESQLFLLMNFMATSIGVKCDYCHVRKGEKYYDGNWVWDSDENPKKLIGRRMIKMALEINRTNFDGETFVTCYTCHRGSTVIKNLPPLPPHDPIPTNVVLPTAEQILKKYFAAVGGKDAAAKFKTTVMKGSIEFDNRQEGRNAQLEVTLKAPDKYLVMQTSPQGVNVIGVNGETVWVGNGNRSRKLSGYTSEWVRRTAVFFALIKVVEQPTQMKVIGTEKIGDRETYVLSFVVNPDVTRRFFFDTQTGLLLRQLTATRTMLAPLPEQVDFDDYRDVDGIKLPFMIRSSITATYDTATRRFTEIRHNLAVDDKVFNLTTSPP
jgi:outer membrane lipoprotein-sorting protein